MSRRTAVRLLRATLLSLPAVGTAAVAHLSVDGCLEIAPLLLALVATGTSAFAVLSAPRRTTTLLAWIVGAQVAGHLLLAVQCDGIAHALAVPGPAMLAAHLGAALVIAPLLARRDAGLATAEYLVSTVCVWFARPAALAPTRPRVALLRASLTNAGEVHLHDVFRRGPPRGR